MKLSIILVGVDHQTAPLALRERLALSGDSLRATLEELRRLPDGRVQEAVILSTCNRLEIYVDGSPQAVEAVT